MANVKFLGTTSDITECECCGKSNLKKTVVLLIDEDVRHYGATCAANALAKLNYPGTLPAGYGWSEPSYPVQNVLRKAEQANRRAALANYRAVLA